MKRLTHSVRNSTCHIHIDVFFICIYNNILSWLPDDAIPSAPMRSLRYTLNICITTTYINLLFPFIFVIIMLERVKCKRNKKKSTPPSFAWLWPKKGRKKKLANINATTNNKNNENNSYKRLCEFLWKFSDTFGIVRWCLDRSVRTQRQSVIWPNGHAHIRFGLRTLMARTGLPSGIIRTLHFYKNMHLCDLGTFYFAYF